MTLQDRLTSEAEFETDEPIPMVAYEAVIYIHKLEQLLKQIRQSGVITYSITYDLRTILDSNK